MPLLDTLMVAAFSLFGGALGYAGWWIMQRRKASAKPAATDDDAPFQPEKPRELRQDPPIVSAVAAPKRPEFQAELESIRAQLGEIAKAQLSLLESERDRGATAPAMPALDAIREELASHREIMTALEGTFETSIAELRLELENKLDSLLSSTQQTAAGEDAVMAELGRVQIAVEKLSAADHQAALLPHIALLGEEMARILAAVSEGSASAALEARLAERFDAAADRIVALAEQAGALSRETRPHDVSGSASATGREDSEEMSPPARGRGLAYIPAQHSGVVTVMNRHQPGSV